MFKGHFYHSKTRKAVAAFGALFNNLYVVRTNEQIKVPLAYAPRAKYLERIRQNPDLDTDTQIALKLPRISFEITSMSYDLTRQLSKINSVKGPTSANTKRNKLHTGVPYVLGFQLSIYAKSQDDALQIVEQILPTFNPQYSLTMKPLAEFPAYKEDIPITITGIASQDDYENSLDARRTIIYTLDFEMRIQYHGYIAEAEIIRQANARVFQSGIGLADSDVRLQTIQVNPNPTSVIGMDDSDFGFTTTIFSADSDYR
jgi:hypothetical protein